MNNNEVFLTVQCTAICFSVLETAMHYDKYYVLVCLNLLCTTTFIGFLDTTVCVLWCASMFRTLTGCRRRSMCLSKHQTIHFWLVFTHVFRLPAGMLCSIWQRLDFLKTCLWHSATGSVVMLFIFCGVLRKALVGKRCWLSAGGVVWSNMECSLSARWCCLV